MLRVAASPYCSCYAPNREPHMPKLLDQVREVICTRHYSLRTENAYVNWIKQYIFFNSKRHPAELGGAEVSAFLSHLAVNRKVAASTPGSRCNPVSLSARPQ